MELISKDKFEPTRPIDKIDSGISLTELSQDFVLVSHAVFMIYGYMPIDPLQRCFEQTFPNSRPYLLISDYPIFEGLASWNNRIIAVENKCWSKCRVFLDSISGLDRKRKLFYRPLRQKLPLTDFRSLSKNIVELHTYGLDGNFGCLHFIPAKSPDGLIRLIKDTPFEDTVKLANQMFMETRG